MTGNEGRNKERSFNKVHGPPLKQLSIGDYRTETKRIMGNQKCIQVCGLIRQLTDYSIDTL